MIVKLTLLFCGAMVLLVFCASTAAHWAGRGVDTQLCQTIVTSCALLSGSVIGAFVFGATWDDRNVMTILGPQAYQDQLPAPAGLPTDEPAGNP